MNTKPKPEDELKKEMNRAAGNYAKDNWNMEEGFQPYEDTSVGRHFCEGWEKAIAYIRAINPDAHKERQFEEKIQRLEKLLDFAEEALNHYAVGEWKPFAAKQTVENIRKERGKV